MAERLVEYKKLIETFLKSGYRCFPFVDAPPEEKALLLRHDVDFDLFLARDMAALESEMRVESTYFVMLRSASYNLLEKENSELVSQIGSYGHHISLHFDPTIYEDFTAGLKKELEVFSDFFGLRPECISIHRPKPFFLECDTPIGDIRHTYQSCYTGQIHYFSDSQGEFRHGSPLVSRAFEMQHSIHLLIHPIWWVTNEVAPVDILNSFLDMRIKRFQNHIAANCKPYRSVTAGDYD